MNVDIKNSYEFIIKNHENVLIQFNVGDTARQWNFPDNPKIRDVNLEGIETYAYWKGSTTIDGGLVYAPTGNDLVTIPILHTTYITLENYAGRQIVKDMPLYTFLTMQSNNIANEQWFKKFNGQRINWPKSYITWVQGTQPDPTVNFVWMFSIFYRDKQSIEQTNKRASFQNRS